MNNQLLRRLLIDEEGIDLNAHQVKGIWHIGIGHNLEIDQTEEELAVLGDYDEDDPSGLSITQLQAEALFDIDVQDAIDDIYPGFTVEELDELGETRRAVILSMCFQMGGSVVRKYKNFAKAVKVGDFDLAAKEMTVSGVDPSQPSKWMKQTPERCSRAAEAMKLGYFPKYEDALLAQAGKGEISESPLTGATDQELLDEIARRFGLASMSNPLKENQND